jgi:hypothetical protein
MKMAELGLYHWRKSSRSGDNGCVEVADNPAGMVGVRDSKDVGGPVLAFEPASWRAFVAAVRVRVPPLEVADPASAPRR